MFYIPTFSDKILSVLFTFWCKIKPGISVGRNCRIWAGSKLKPPLYIDDNVEIGRPIEKSTHHRLSTHIGSCSQVRRNSVIYEGASIGSNASIGHNVVIRERSIFGDDIYIKANTYVGVDVVAGDRVTIANLVGDRSVLDHDVTCLGALIHTSKGPHRGEIETGPHIGAFAFIGRQAVLVGHINIGSGCYINAGSLVKDDVPDSSIVKPRCLIEIKLKKDDDVEEKNRNYGKVTISERRIQRSNTNEYLHAHFRSVDTGSKHPVIVFSHGFTVDGLESHRLFLEAARESNRRGFSTVLFDYPGIGWSDGDYVDFRLSKAPEELLTIVTAAVNEVECNGTVIIWGQSLGTAIAALAEQNLRNVCVGMVLWNLSADIESRYPRIFGPDITKSDSFCIPDKGLFIGKSFIEDAAKVNIIEKFRDWNTPVFFLNAGSDEKSSVEYANRAIENCNSSLVTRVIIEGANHSFKCQPEFERDAIAKTCNWIEKLS